MTPTPSRRVVSIVDSIRKDFSAYVEACKSLSVRRSHIAPSFMRAYDAWHRETGRPFVAFVQMLDASVPADRSEYVAHPSFRAALYLKRLVEAPETVAGRGRSSISPFQLLAAVLKSLAPIVGPTEATHAFAVVVKHGKLHRRDVERLRKRVKTARVLPLLSHQPRLVAEKRRLRLASPLAAAADDSRRSRNA